MLSVTPIHRHTILHRLQIQVIWVLWMTDSTLIPHLERLMCNLQHILPQLHPTIDIDRLSYLNILQSITHLRRILHHLTLFRVNQWKTLLLPMLVCGKR